MPRLRSLRGLRRRAVIAAGAVCVLASLSVAAVAKAPSRHFMPKARRFAGVRTVGALFSRASSAQHYCTASVVDSPRGDVLLTAAHCVSGTATGLVFAPGYHDGQSIYGRWSVSAAYLDPAWIRRQDPRRDFAFLTVAPEPVRGRRSEIEQVTGASRLGLRAKPGRRVTIPAYPVGTDDEPLTCTASLYYRGLSPAFDCEDYVDGTSGAPWLAHTPSGTEVVGVIGGLHQGGCLSSTSYSPPFGAAARRAYLRAVHHDAPDVAPVAGSDGC